MSTNVPVTVWQPNNGDGELSNSTPYSIVDPSGNQLVDTVANVIIDTGVLFTGKPTTVWSEDDGR
jgi:hypothetical protein